MGKLLDDLKKELNNEIEGIEKEVRKVLFNAVGVAQKINEERVDTGFMINNWFFARSLPTGEPLKRPQGEQAYSPMAAATSRNITNWKLGENAFIVNNVEYASYHDLGTIHISPLFISFQVENYLNRELSRIK